MTVHNGLGNMINSSLCTFGPTYPDMSLPHIPQLTCRNSNQILSVKTNDNTSNQILTLPWPIKSTFLQPVPRTVSRI